MQSVEEFMREFLAAHVAEEERLLAVWKPFRERFFTPDCPWDNREGTLEMLQSEEIISIAASESKPSVITAATILSRSVPQKQHFRYHLTATDRWLIWHVELECQNCKTHGDENCPICHGKHWL
jgi:hypothetical protein